MTYRSTLKLPGTLAPAGPGKVDVARYRFVSGAWKLIGTTTITLPASGTFIYALKPNARGKWKFIATYSGGSGGGHGPDLREPGRSSMCRPRDR